MMLSSLPRTTATLLAGAAVVFGFAACNNAPQPTQNVAGAAKVAPQVPPPPLPVYHQPPIPADGYIWTPGYWAWDDGVGDYYWVPGTWVQPPRAGLLWTPGYWAVRGGGYTFNPGYWGPEVGFYGSIDYGFGYGGSGYEGGRWQGDRFYYNLTVNNISAASIRYVYRQDVASQGGPSHVSFYGPGGASARGGSAEGAPTQGPRVEPTPIQVQHEQLARTNPGLRASVNHGRPPIAATPRPAMFDGPGVVTDATENPHGPPADVGAPPHGGQPTTSDTGPPRNAPDAHPAAPRTSNPHERNTEQTGPAQAVSPPGNPQTPATPGHHGNGPQSNDQPAHGNPHR